MTDPATTIREALATLYRLTDELPAKHRVEAVTKLMILDGRLDALTELEQQLATEVRYRVAVVEESDARLEAAERERDQLDALLNESIRDHQKTAQERDQLQKLLDEHGIKP